MRVLTLSIFLIFCGMVSIPAYFLSIWFLAPIFIVGVPGLVGVYIFCGIIADNIVEYSLDKGWMDE